MNSTMKQGEQAAQVQAAKVTGAKAGRRAPMLAGLVATLLAVIFLLGCAPLPPADAPQSGGSTMAERRPAHWQVDGGQRVGNHGTRQR